ncbi:MAG: carboxylate-amine ligase [Acidimicrobiaceae bacterium]|nr:carboxylate-amine ligase [Acidimicrobiia bacterium]MCY4494349.1 carboxylate-amine ligase [Acidimicrobiaceae bacterium]
MSEEPAWTLGIEEEYLLVERDTGALVKKQPPGLMEKVVDLRHGLVARELFSSQIEIATSVCTDVKYLRADVGLLRLAVQEAADEYGLAPIASSTHPFARWAQLEHTQGERYEALVEDLQGVSRQLIISGLHVHVGIDDPDLRIDLMNQAVYFLPHLLALSTSSPFWEGIDTGLKSYRTSLFATLPRTGLPEKFNSWSEYCRHVDVLVNAGIIEDSSKVWWHIRPSDRYPTLEMRVTDLPTRMEDTISVAAMYVCLLRMLWRLKMENRRWRNYANFLVSENLWRAERYGIGGELIDFGKGELVPFAELVAELVELVRPDAEALNCVGEVEHALTICERGTSADRQLAVYQGALDAGATNDEAIKAVVDALITDSIAPPLGPPV